MKMNIRQSIKTVLLEYYSMDEYSATLNIDSDTYGNIKYEDLKKTLKGKGERRIGNNTVLRTLSNGDIAIRYHYTDIFVMNVLNNMRIYTGGWDTVTTIQRLNYLLPRNVRIFKKKGELLISGSNGTFPFKDGMLITQNGDIHF